MISYDAALTTYACLMWLGASMKMSWFTRAEVRCNGGQFSLWFIHVYGMETVWITLLRRTLASSP